MDAKREQQIFKVAFSQGIARIVDTAIGEEVLIGREFGKYLWDDIKSTNRTVAPNECADRNNVIIQHQHQEYCTNVTRWWHNGKKLFKCIRVCSNFQIICNKCLQYFSAQL